MGLTTKLSVIAQADLSSQLDLSLASAPMTKAYIKALTDGTVAGKADRVFHDKRTLAPSATENLDLNGVLLDPLGGACNFVKIKGLVIAAADGNANDVIVGAAATNPWVALLGAAGTVTVKPGAVFAAFAGQNDSNAYAVIAATGDLLKIANSAGGTPVDYDVIIIGTSA